MPSWNTWKNKTSLVQRVGTKVPGLICFAYCLPACNIPCTGLLCGSSLLGQQNSVDVGQHTSWCNRYSSQQTVQFLIILYGKSNVTGNNTGLLVVTSCVSSKFQNFGAKVFKNGSKVYRRSSSHTRCVLALTQVTTDTTNGELQSCLGRCSGGLLFSTASLSFSYNSPNTQTRSHCQKTTTSS